MVDANLEFITEGKFGFLVEREPIEVAAILAADQHRGQYSTDSKDLLLDCVVMDPRYLPKGFTDFELLKVRGRRLGRTIDILLDDPITVKETGEDHRILTFKGCGAFPEGAQYTGDWIIDPTQWHSESAKQLGRVWGGVSAEGAAMESQKDFTALEKLGLKLTPYLHSNDIPKEVLEIIYGNEDPFKLGQPIRLCKTNVMLSDVFPFEESIPLFGGSWHSLLNGLGKGTGTIDPETFFKNYSHESLVENLLSMIELVANVSQNLYQTGKMLTWTVGSEFTSNSYISGEIKDFENISVTDLSSKEPWVVDDVHSEIMQNVGRSVLQTKGTHRVFQSEETVKEFVKGNGSGPLIITNSGDFKYSEKQIFVPAKDSNLNPFLIHGIYDEEDGAIWEYSFSNYSLKQALELDAKLRKEGLRLAQREHLVYLAQNGILQRMYESHSWDMINLHTLSAIDHRTNTLHDRLSLRVDGTIDYDNTKKTIVSNPMGDTIIKSWDELTNWPMLYTGNEGNNCNRDKFYVGQEKDEEPGLVPVGIGYSNYGSRYTKLLANEFNCKRRKLQPLVIRELK